MAVNKIIYDGETLIDLTEDEVTEDTLAEGVTAHNKKGEKITGRAVFGGGEAVSDVLWVSGEMNLAAMSISNLSHTYDEFVSAMDEGKLIKFKCAYVLPTSPTEVKYAYGDVVVKEPDEILGQIMVQANIGAGLQLYYFSVNFKPDNTITVTPYVVNTTVMGG